MTDYFKTGEFASLRNTTKRALRYYEELGLLSPAQEKETNSYHYYHEGQLTTLDVIQFCTRIGINLKELVPYVGKDGTLDYAGIQKICRDHVDMQLKHLESMKLLLNDMELLMESCNQHRFESGGYIRSIIPRTVICRKLNDWQDHSGNQAELSRLYAYCDAHDILHTYTYGIIQHIQGGRTDYYMYTQILDDAPESPDIMHLPGGNYLCYQDNARKMDIPECFLPQLSLSQDKRIISTSMLFDRVDLTQPVWEKQLLLPEGSNQLSNPAISN